MVLYGNELPTSTAPPPIHKHSENKKRSSKSKKNLNMTERILIFDLTDINQIIHVCIISI